MQLSAAPAKTGYNTIGQDELDRLNAKICECRYPVHRVNPVKKVLGLMGELDTDSVRIRIRWNTGSVEGGLDDSSTSASVVESLPHATTVSTWGQEIYFSVPAESELNKSPQTVVEPGAICFWVQGSSIAIPFGPTPIAEKDECRLVTAVNVIGKLEGDPLALASLREGDAITIEAAD